MLFTIRLILTDKQRSFVYTWTCSQLGRSAGISNFGHERTPTPLAIENLVRKKIKEIVSDILR